MSSSTPIAAPQLDPQDPLPEGNFTHRRAIVYILTLGLIGLFSLAAWVILQLGGPSALIVDLVHTYSAVFALVATYYYIAPSAEQLAKIIATLKALKAGIPFKRAETIPSAPPTPVPASEHAAPAEPVQAAPEAVPAQPRDPWDKP